MRKRTEARERRHEVPASEDRATEIQLLAYTAMHPEDLSAEEMTFLRIRFGQLVRRLA